MSQEHIDEIEVHRVAQLANLDLSEQQAIQLKHDLNTILQYMEQLRELDVSQVEPTVHAIPLEIPLREDIPAKNLSRDEVLANAPRTEGGMFEVPLVLEGGN